MATAVPGVRARARVVIHRAGEWPCKLGHASKDGLEGMEMGHLRNGEYCLPFKAGPSPKNVDIAESWDFIPRGGLNMDSVAAALSTIPAASYLSKGEVGMGAEKMANQSNQRYGGGVFASIRGAHNTWQNHTEFDASNTRQKHSLSMALQKNRVGGTSESEVTECKETDAWSRHGSTGPGRITDAAPGKRGDITAGNESLMGILMRGLHDDASSTFTSMTRNAPSGYTGVRASAFALVSSNAVASGRPSPDRYAEAPPRIHMHQPSTSEGVAAMSSAASSRPVEGCSSVLNARRPESAVSVRKSTGRNIEW